MKVDGWNHNTHYHELLLQEMPRPCRRALDVGCGLGRFARRLAGIAEYVDALDVDPGIVCRARRLSSGISNLDIAEGDFMAWQAARSYDFISMIATLHHLPFVEALTRAKRLLEPGGVLGVIGLDRAYPWIFMPVRIGRQPKYSKSEKMPGCFLKRQPVKTIGEADFVVHPDERTGLIGVVFWLKPKE